MTFFTLLGLIVFTGIVFINILSVIFWMMKEITMEDFESTFNPISIYQETNLNIVGCVVCIALSHIFFMFPAVMYWIYRLFLFIKGKIKRIIQRNGWKEIK